MRERVRARFGIAALLLCASVALPAAPAASEEPSTGAKIFDCAVLRPFGLATVIVGGALFVPAALLASGAGVVPLTVFAEEADRARAANGIETAWRHFVLDPVENTFERPLGDF